MKKEFAEKLQIELEKRINNPKEVIEFVNSIEGIETNEIVELIESVRLSARIDVNSDNYISPIALNGIVYDCRAVGDFIVDDGVERYEYIDCRLGNVLVDYFDIFAEWYTANNWQHPVKLIDKKTGKLISEYEIAD